MSVLVRATAVLCGLAAAAGCRSTTDAPSPAAPSAPSSASAAPASVSAGHWWNDRVFYEIFVRSFADSTTGPLANDGIGDFQGLIDKLDYLNDGNPATTSDLGITGIWLMPINPSPSYHGYDVTDYYGINPQFGTQDDFRRFLAECHQRGIKVIVDLVLNHSSSQHPYFKQALAGDPQYRDWYLFVDADKVPQTRGPWGQQVWQEAHGQHFFGIFWSGMPDLNYRNPAVTAEAYKVADFWLRDLHVDGFRLDAVRHLIEDGDAMNDTPATLAWLKGFAAQVKSVQPDAMLVGEIWTNTEVVSDYVQQGSLDLAFEFDLAGAIVDAANTGTKAKLAYALDNVVASYPASQFATFMTNHDQDRVASVLREDPARLRLAAALLLTAPGVPFLYYGEEIGQVGAKPDEMIRNPMPWTSGRNGGFTAATQPWEPLQPDDEKRNVAAQHGDPGSLLSFYRRLIRLRQSEPALANGDFRAIETGRDDVIAWQRSRDGRQITIIANLGDSELHDLRIAGIEGTLHDLVSGMAMSPGEGLFLAPRTAYVLAAAQ
jgi:glycosidase